MMVPQLQSVLVFVRDLDRAIFFYCGTLGFPLRAHWTGGAEVGADGTALTLALVENDDAVPLTGRSTGMTFAVDRATYEQLAAREVFAAEPTVYSWGAFAPVADPDGNEFAITAPGSETAEGVDDTQILPFRTLQSSGNSASPELVTP